MSHIFTRVIFTLCCVLALTGCNTAFKGSPPSLAERTASKPIITQFDGRLLVIEPTRRWQASIHWQANLHEGYARLTHAASSYIIEIQWLEENIRMRSNQNPHWQAISKHKLIDLGIILPPQMLAAILHHQIPSVFQSQGKQTWQGKFNGSLVRFMWKNNMRQLNITDITHGRTAMLKMNP